jgi:hypothetical protein
MRALITSGCLVCGLVWLNAGGWRPAAAAQSPRRIQVERSDVPTDERQVLENQAVSFEPSDDRPATDRYRARGGSYSLDLSPSGATFTMHRRKHLEAQLRHEPERSIELETPVSVSMTLEGANEGAVAAPGRQLPGFVNEFNGNDPASWRTRIPTFESVTYHDVYQGVDVVFMGVGPAWRYDVVVAPGADVRQLAWRIHGANARIGERGELLLVTDVGTIRQSVPYAYQQVGTERRQVAARFRIEEENRLAFDLGHYDPQYSVVIDPTVTVSTYLGETAGEGKAIGLGPGGVFVAGVTATNTAFVALYSADGMTRTAIANFGACTGGTSVATALGFSDFDGDGTKDRLHITGWTTCSNFPLVLAGQTKFGGVADAFAMTLDLSTFAVLASTYVGGSNGDYGRALVVDDDASTFHIVGETQSNNLPNAARAFAGQWDVFQARLYERDSAWFDAFYFGGSGTDIAYGAALAYVYTPFFSSRFIVVGSTSSTDLPGANANAGGVDAFVVDFSTANPARLIGGSGDDTAKAVTYCPGDAPRLCVTGDTSSTNLPLLNPVQATFGGSYDAFALALEVTTLTPTFSSYLGGSGYDSGLAIAVDAWSGMVIGGSTYSSNFRTVAPIQAALAGGADAFVTRIVLPRSTGAAVLRFSTFLGGPSIDVGNAITSFESKLWLSGYASAGFPVTPNAYDQVLNGDRGFLTVIDYLPHADAISPSSGPMSGGTLFTITGMDFIPGARVEFLSRGTATSVVVPNPTTISGLTPTVSYVGATDVFVHLSSGEMISAGRFTFVGPTPTISGFSPSEGPTTGSLVQITGTNFSLPRVYFGATTGVVATWSSTSISVYAPAAPRDGMNRPIAGPTTVRVVNLDGTEATAAPPFFYRYPSLASIEPAVGPSAGGTPFLLRGNNFVAGAQVFIGGTAATGLTVVPPSVITGLTPPGASGARDVTVVNYDSSNGVLPGAFVYVGATPTVRLVSPGTGATSGATTVTIVGTNFVDGLTVSFGGTLSPRVVVASSTTLTAVSPPHVAGTVSVTVTNPGNNSASNASAFTYTGDGAVADQLFMEFGGPYGLWRRFAQGGSTSWTQVHTMTPSVVAGGYIDNNVVSDLVAVFPGYGTWIWMNNVSWVQLHAFDATDVKLGDLDGNGLDEIVLDFPGYGVWVRMNNTSWTKLHPLNSAGIAIGNLDGDLGRRADVVINFTGYGVWTWYNNTNWSQLHAFNADDVLVGDLDGNGKAEVVLSFPNLGVWIRKNDAAWIRLHGVNPAGMALGNVDGDDGGHLDLVINFPGFGVWVWREGEGFSLLHAQQASILTTADVDGNGMADVIVGFVRDGTWISLNGTSWEQMHPFTAEAVVSGRGTP